MRRVTRQDDRGIATILVVLMMPLLVLFSALVFDGGRGVLARRQTQNAADAGALAKATDCALSVSGTNFGPYQTNGAVVGTPLPTCGGGTTKVTMTKNISFMFRPGGGNRDVTRSATANWGTIGAATTLPITIASCEFNEARLNGDTNIILYLDDPSPQEGCSNLPGGFSQLLSGANCAVTATAGGSLPGKTGVDVHKQIPCITNPDPSQPPLPYTVLIPMYDEVVCKTTCQNGQGPYLILGFAMFKVTSYSFGGNFRYPDLGHQCPDRGPGVERCIKGDFIKFVTSQGTPGTSEDFGVFQVHLTS